MREVQETTRRELMLSIARCCLGVGAASHLGFGPQSVFATPRPLSKGKAKRVIYLFMNGALSHLDSFDPKPGTEAQGETQPIGTSIPGVQFGDRFPQLAARAKMLAVVRSMTTETGAHEQGRYAMRTSYSTLNSIRHPAFGAWMLNAGFRGDPDLPHNVLIGADNDHPMAGFLPPGYAPVPVGDPELGLQNTMRPASLSASDFDRRMELAKRFDEKFRTRYPSREIDAYDQMYRDAVRLMGSSKLSAFDISEETTEIREAYGHNPFGQGCLLARRLIEHQTPFVEVNFGGWDMHNNLYERLDELAPQLDQGLSSLLDDLQQRGLLDETIVALVTEFGRTPIINKNAGRDHHPGVFSCLLAGGAIRAGQVYGSSDATGTSIDSNGVTVSEFNATIATALGMSTKDETIAPNGRPFTIADGADAIDDLLA